MDPLWTAQPRLALRWRRAMVATGAIAAAGIGTAGSSVPISDAVRLTLVLTLSMLLLASLWLLADEVRPWLSSDGIGPEERAQADTALRRAYGVLFALAIALMLYLYAIEYNPGLLPDPQGAGTTILWHLVGLILVLPVWIAAWSESSDDATDRGLGPLGLLASRFKGPSAPGYAVGAVAFLTVLPVLLAGRARVRGGSALWIDEVLVFALLVAVVSGVLFVRDLLTGPSRRSGH